MFDYAKSAKDRGFEVIIAGAGGAAHLPGKYKNTNGLTMILCLNKSRSLCDSALLFYRYLANLAFRSILF